MSLQPVNPNDDLEKMFILLFALCSLFFVTFIILTYHDLEDSDWWTGVLCTTEGGVLKVQYGFDKCIINGTQHRAQFVPSGRFSNTTFYRGGARSAWELVED